MKDDEAAVLDRRQAGGGRRRSRNRRNLPAPPFTAYDALNIRHRSHGVLGDNCPFDESCEVSVVTLDALIARHGPPAFCKIDVEGYEPEVLHGLTHAVSALCFEFHGELLADAERCLDHLEALGMSRFNVLLYPVGGHWLQPSLDRLFLPAPVSKERLLATCETLSPHKLSGDIYAFQGSCDS